MTAYEQMSPIERAVADARQAFQNVLGHDYHDSRRTHSLYMLKGIEVRRARFKIEYALREAQIKHGDSPGFYLPILREAAEGAIIDLQRVKQTKVNAERIDNCLSQLEDVVEYTQQAEADTDAARARKLAEESTRWPENKERGQELQRWASCLTIGLDLIDFFGEHEEIDEDVWDWSPKALATAISDVREREEHEEYRDLFTEVINALDDGNVTGAWMTMYEFARNRKDGEA